jgi:hypothetical protein
MRLPENLALDDVADVARRLGAATDRISVARALRNVTIRGVKEPETPRGKWRIPRARLHECVGAVLLRREERKPGWRNLDPDSFVQLAAESMLCDPDLEGYVPRRLKAEILERQRLEEEERARAERRARRERATAERRAREREERAERNQAIADCYWRCRIAYQVRWGLARPDINVWQDEEFKREWPRDRPRWWAPPPQMLDAMMDFNRRRDATRNFNLDFDTEARGWQEWLPPYEPGKPWPWRKVDTERPEDAAGAQLA